MKRGVYLDTNQNYINKNDDERWKNIKFNSKSDYIKKVIPYVCFNVSDENDYVAAELPPPLPIPLRDIPAIKAPSNLFFELTVEDEEENGDGNVESSISKRTKVIPSPEAAPCPHNSSKGIAEIPNATKSDEYLNSDTYEDNDDDKRWKNIKFNTKNDYLKKIIPYVCFNVNDHDKKPPPLLRSQASCDIPSVTALSNLKIDDWKEDGNVELAATKSVELLPPPESPLRSTNSIKAQSNSKTVREDFYDTKMADTVIIKKLIPYICFSDFGKPRRQQRRLPQRSSNLMKLEVNSFLKPENGIVHETSKPNVFSHRSNAYQKW